MQNPIWSTKWRRTSHTSIWVVIKIATWWVDKIIANEIRGKTSRDVEFGKPLHIFV